METLDVVVIGAGVVGLAVARVLAMAGREVFIVESADAIGSETSSRNSEVIHAGIYYPTKSLKRFLCVAGRDALYDYCEERAIAHRRCEKLIVSTHQDQEYGLRAIEAQACANGVTDLAWLSGEEARTMEPALACTAALLSPSTGIIDSHALMLALLGDAEAQGAVLALRTPVCGGRVSAAGLELAIGGTQPMRVRSRTVINCAGLHAPAVAAMLAGFPPAFVPPSYLCKGNYYILQGAPVFSRLIYPMPESTGVGLGVHVTVDLAGRMRFGPDVQWVDRIDYSVDPGRAQEFYAAIRAYWPDLPDDALAPGYAGIRPKLHPPGGPAQDFVIEGPAAHGTPGLVNLFGIESPGLTACLAIGDYVQRLLD